MTALPIALTLAAFGLGAWLGVLWGRKQGWIKGASDTLDEQQKLRQESRDNAASAKRARRSDGAKRAAITRKRNRETPQA